MRKSGTRRLRIVPLLGLQAPNTAASIIAKWQQRRKLRLFKSNRFP